nr:immunoglobulin light chain junction region [Macaca mulatta]
DYYCSSYARGDTDLF